MNTTPGRRRTTALAHRDDQPAQQAVVTSLAQRHTADGELTTADMMPSGATWWAFTSAHDRVGAQINRIMLRDFGLSLPETSILLRLAAHQGRKLRISHLARDLQWEPSRLSRHLARMEREGLLVREHDPDDGRAALLGLTEHGSRAAEAADTTYWDLVDRLFLTGVSPEQLTAFTEILDHLLDATEEPRSTPEP